MISKSLSELYNINQSLNVLIKEKFDSNFDTSEDRKNEVVLGLLTKSVTTHTDVLTLYRAGSFFSALELSRSILEAQVNLIWVLKDPSGKNLEAYCADVWNQKRMLTLTNGALNKNGALYEALQHRESLNIPGDTSLNEIDEMAKHFKSDKLPTIEKRFKDIEQSDSYPIQYRLPSNFAHSTCLVLGHYLHLENKGIRPKFEKHGSIFAEEALCISFAALYGISEAAYEVLEVNLKAELDGLEQRYVEICTTDEKKFDLRFL